MARKPDHQKETPSQTAGPFVHIGLAPAAAGLGIFERELGHVIAGPECEGERIRVTGRVLDGAGAAVTDVLIEVWQADARGRYNRSDEGRAVEPDFTGFGRVVPDFATGVFSFDTVKPGPVAESGGDGQAPHLNLWLVARGINLGLNTRMYFADEDKANAADPVLGRIDTAARRRTLIAGRGDTGGNIGGDTGSPPVYRFDIHLQGGSETVFLDI